MPDGNLGAIGDVLFLSAEDDPEDTTLPRLMAHDADLDRVHFIRAVVDNDRGPGPVSLPRDLALVERTVRDTGAVLVVIDVLAAYLDAGVDSHKDADIRRALHSMKDTAEALGVTFLLLRHLNKTAGPKALYRGGGSIGIIGAARAGWTLANHPTQENLRVLATTKMNLAPRPVPLGFMLLPVVELGCARLDWQGEVNIEADTLLNPPTRATQEESQERESKAEQAENAISMLLSLGDMWSDELLNEVVKKLGIGTKTYDTARAKLTFAWPETKPDGTKGWRVRLK